MATIVDRRNPGPFAPVAAHHVRDPAWAPPPHHTRRGRGARPVRHGGKRRRYVWRDLGVAVLVLAAAVGVVVGLMEVDPASREAALELVRQGETATRAWVGDLPLP